MGYFVTLVDSDFEIPKQNLDEAYKRLIALNEDDDKKGGGRFPPRMKPASEKWHPDKWFRWMPYNYPDTCKDTQAIFEKLGFDCHLDDEGNLHLDGYHSKTGDEMLFLHAVRDLAHGHTEWIGEDDEEYEFYAASTIDSGYEWMEVAE